MKNTRVFAVLWILSGVFFSLIIALLVIHSYPIIIPVSFYLGWCLLGMAIDLGNKNP